MGILRWLILVMLTTTGCAVTDSSGQRLRLRSDAFADYVERVFRRQNEILAELTLALESEPFESARFDLLENAELDLLTACSGLNELARANRDGDPPRGPGALRIARQAPECDRATDQAATLL